MKVTTKLLAGFLPSWPSSRSKSRLSRRPQSPPQHPSLCTLGATAAQLSQYFKPHAPIRTNGNHNSRTPGDGHYITETLRRKPTFRHHNLLADPF